MWGGGVKSNITYHSYESGKYDLVMDLNTCVETIKINIPV